MTESQIPTISNPTTGDEMNHSVKVYYIVVLWVIGAIILFILLYHEASKMCKLSPEIEKNRAKWENHHITHYRMSLNSPIFDVNYSQLPLTVEVKDGEVFSMVDAHGEDVSLRNDENIIFHYPDKMTIPGLFSFVDRTCSENPPEIKATYDSDLGYPTTIFLNPYTEPCCQEFTIEVRDFEVLP